MPTWVDLSEHEVSLNVVNSPDGKKLLLRPLRPEVKLPLEIARLGFQPSGSNFERRDLKFSLRDIQSIFPNAKPRDIPLSEILFSPAPSHEYTTLVQGMEAVTAIAAEMGGSLSPWEMQSEGTLGEWRYSNLTIGQTDIRIAVSGGGVVQVNRDPYTKEGRKLHVTRERIIESIKALLPVEMSPAPAAADQENLLPRIIELPDDKLRRLAKILGTAEYNHSNWRSFTEIDIHSLDNDRIRDGLERLETEPGQEAAPANARAPWLVTREKFVSESIFEADPQGNRVIFDGVSYPTSEKSAMKAKAEVHERMVSDALYGRSSAAFPPSLPPFEVMLDYPAAIYRLNQRAEKNVSRLMSQLGVGEKLLQGEDNYLKVINPPYMDLVIERHDEPNGQRLYFTHYYRSNGDTCMDCEMVFVIRPNGTLRLVETATQNPIRGGELRGLDVSFANMFSKNLLDQEFGKARVIWPREESDELDSRYFNERGQIYEARLEEYMNKVILKGNADSTLVFAVDDDGKLLGEKLVTGSNKASITRAQNAFLSKYGNFTVLGYSTMPQYMRTKGRNVTYDLPVAKPDWLIEGEAYDVAMYKVVESRHWRNIQTGATASIHGAAPYQSEADANDWEVVSAGYTVHNLKTNQVGIGKQPWKTREEAETWILAQQTRYWEGAVFRRLDKSFAGNGNGSEFVAMFAHDRSSTTVTVPFDEISAWHDQGLIRQHVPADARQTKHLDLDPSGPEDYAKVMSDPELQLEYQDKLDAMFQERLVDVRNALRIRGWEGSGATLTCKTEGSVHGVTHKTQHVGAGRNVVAITWSVDDGTSMVPDDLSGTAEELADRINALVGPQIKVEPPANYREFKVYEEGFRHFLPVNAALDIRAMMEAVTPYTSSEKSSVAIPPFAFPEGVSMELNGARLRISAAGYTCDIVGELPPPQFDDENKPWLRKQYERDFARTFVAGLYNSAKCLEIWLAWEAKKSTYPDGGKQLQDLANGYAAYLHEKMPSNHDGKVGEMHQRFAIAILDKDIDYLMSWIARGRGSNDNSKKFFTEATGCKLPQTIKGITAALYAWAGHSPEEASRIQQEKAMAEEKRIQAKRIDNDIEWLGRQLENQKASHNGTIKTLKQFMDECIADGYTVIGERKRGAVTRYILENPSLGRCYDIKGAMVDYARAVLAKAAELKPVVLEEPKLALRP